jgi:HKD family nuclease
MRKAGMLRGLIDNSDDRAVIVSLPSHFNLEKELTTASEIRLAMAFARMTGWKHFQKGILAGKAAVCLLAGLDFMQTEPKLLHEWVRLAEQNERITASLASRDSTFHPKVMIVKGKDSDFAIVGSGNLTNGGLRTNTECGLYVTDRSEVRTLNSWFENRWREGTELKLSAILEYAPKYKKARKAAKKIQNDQQQVQKQIVHMAQLDEQRRVAALKDMKAAVAAFKAYRKQPIFKNGYQKRLRAVESIRNLLDIPHFNFDRDSFNEFYKIPELGWLREGYRDGIFKQNKRLRRALQYLVDESVPIERRINSILKPSGTYHVRGLGRGGLSKILTSAYPDKWAVLNGPVDKTLDFFGYEPPKRLGIGERYREFAKLMHTFKIKTGAPDFIALDAFFKFWEQKMKRRQ